MSIRIGHLQYFILAAGLAIPAGAQVTSVTRISATPAGAGYTVDGQNYTVPTSDIWPQGSKHLLSATPVETNLNSGTQYVFQDWLWTGGQFKSPDFTITADPSITSYTAEFTLNYALTVDFYGCGNGTGGSPGTVTVNNTSGSCDFQTFIGAGQPAIVQAIPNDGYVFVGWGNGVNQTLLGFQNTVTMNGPMTVYPIFAPTRTVNLTTAPVNLSVLADRSPIAAPYAIQWGMGTTHTVAAITPQTDIQGNNWVFSSWSDGGAAMHAYTVATVNFADTLTATYVPGVGATFTTSPGGLNLTIDGVTPLPPYNYVWGVGETHTFSAPAQQTDSTGHVWQFSSWSNGGAASQTVAVASSAVPLGLRYVATYTPVGHLIVNNSVAGANITINGQPCATPCELKQPVGTKIDIGATASIPNGNNSRLDLTGWSGGVTSGPGDLVITLGADPITVSPAYQQMNYLAMAANPSSSATWTVQPASSDGFYSAAATVSLSVAPLPGFKFRSWTGDLSGTAPSGAVTMATPRSVTALFDKVPYVSPAGVQNAAGVTPLAAVAPGSVVSLFGANLAIATAVSSANPLPQSLGGVTAVLGQQFLPLFFTSPAQLNFQLPDGTPLGQQTLTIASQGLGNIQANINVVRNAPGLFQQTVDNQAFALAYHADGTAVNASSPAQIGETITVYGTGFGPTDPPRLEGYVLPASPVFAIVDPVTVTAGSVTAPAAAAYALAGSVGVDAVQFAITDPAASGTNTNVVVTVNGQASNSVLVPVQ